jgi:hypothetical protein
MRPGQDLVVTLYWRAEAAGSARYKVFVHLIGADGTLLSQHDGEPAQGVAPTSQWLAREVIADSHTIPIPVDIAGDEATLYVGMYSPGTGERLLALGFDGTPYPNNAISLRTIPVTAGD